MTKKRRTKALKPSVFELKFDGKELRLLMSVPTEGEPEKRHMRFLVEYRNNEALRAAMMRFIAEAMFVEKTIAVIDEDAS